MIHPLTLDETAREVISRRGQQQGSLFGEFNNQANTQTNEQRNFLNRLVSGLGGAGRGASTALQSPIFNRIGERLSRGEFGQGRQSPVRAIASGIKTALPFPFSLLGNVLGGVGSVLGASDERRDIDDLLGRDRGLGSEFDRNIGKPALRAFDTGQAPELSRELIRLGLGGSSTVQNVLGAGRGELASNLARQKGEFIQQRSLSPQDRSTLASRRSTTGGVSAFLKGLLGG
jgi:hypothetical protein